MTVLLRCLGAGILSAFAALILKKSLPEFSAALSALAAVFILFQCLSPIKEILSCAEEILSEAGISGYASLLVKSLGLSALTKISGDICGECGQSGLASAIEALGSASLLALSIPTLKELFGLLAELI